MTQSKLELELSWMIHVAGLPEPVQQYVVPETSRKHLWDFAFLEQRLLVDVQGGTWVSNSGHTSGTGIERDCEKMVLATLAGYRVMFVTGLQVKDGRAVQWIEQALKATGATERGA